MFRVESDLPRKSTGRANSKTFLAQGAQANSQATRSVAELPAWGNLLELRYLTARAASCRSASRPPGATRRADDATGSAPWMRRCDG